MPEKNPVAKLEPIIAVAKMIELEKVKLPLTPVSKQIVDEMGEMVGAIKTLIARKRDLSDLADAMYQNQSRAAMVGMALPEAVTAAEQASTDVKAIVKVLSDALRTLDREVGSGDEDEEE